MQLMPYAMYLMRLCVWLVLLTAILTPLERLFALYPQRIFRRGIATDFAYYFLSSLVPTFLLTVPLAVVAWAAHSVVPPAVSASIAAWPLWLRILSAVLVGEIGFYWGHRWSHEIPLLWRFHALHHSSEELDWLVATRAHPFDLVFTRLCGLVPLYVLGLAAPLRGSPTLIPLLVVVIGTMWGFFIHANLRWRFGTMEHLVATPAFHHWHHTNDGAEYFNKNYAPMLPWIDRIFGTLYLPASHPTRYGLDQPTAPGLALQLMQPFQSAAREQLADYRATAPQTL